MTKLHFLLLSCVLFACDPPPRTQPSSQPNAQPEAPAPQASEPNTPPPTPAPEPSPTSSAPTKKGDYDPCVGRPCGAPCNICAPDDPDCVETAVVKACNEQGKCLAETPKCAPR
jgi:hypothetical protein